MQWLPIVAGAVILLLVLQRIPYVGAAIRLVFSVGLIALFVLLIAERAPFDPMLARFTSGLNLDNQQVVGDEVRIRMASDGHFWAKVKLNGVSRRMMVDSGATFTAISERTAEEAGLKPRRGVVPVVLRTANGTVAAQTASVEELRLEAILARDLQVVVSPALGEMDLLGMNFLSRLKSWRVEGKTLVLVPHHPQPTTAAD
jgi:aspartyl protease family protein